MNENFEKLKPIYDQVLELTSEIKKQIKNENFNQDTPAFLKKDELVKEISQIIKNAELSQEEKENLNSIIKKIKIIEEENIKSVNDYKEAVLSRISTVRQSHKAISAYKIKKEQTPRLFDVKE